MLEGVRTVRSLALLMQSFRYNEPAEQYQHLRRLPVTDDNSVTPVILIRVGHTVLTATSNSERVGRASHCRNLTCMGSIRTGARCEAESQLPTPHL